MTKIFRLVGRSVDHSPTPHMMNASFSHYNLDAHYEARNASKASEAVRLCLDSELSGCNITMPYKRVIFRYVQEKDGVCLLCGAVNTVVRRGGKLAAYNTDYHGILRALRGRGIDSVGTACVIGTGGACRAFLCAVKELGCREALILTRDKERARRRLSDLRHLGIALKFLHYWELDGGVDLLFNASPIGSPGVSTPLELIRAASKADAVFDAVYYPVNTELLLAAQKEGRVTIYGYEMLLYQAAKAFEIFTGMDAPEGVMEGVLKRRLGVVEG